MSYTTYEIKEKSKQSLYPFMALVAYRNGDDGIYAESHDIGPDGCLLAGCPVSEDFVSELAGAFTQEQSVTPYGRIPGNMLYFDSRTGYQKYIWYNPPGKRMMYFAKALNIPNGEYCVPGIIYVAGDTSLCLYAFKGNKPGDKLYKAPFFNTTDGSVCLGSAKLDYPRNPSFDDFIAYWEKKFWLTEFTHLGGSQSPVRNSLSVVTKNSVDKFDTGELIEMDVTLKDILNQR